MPSFTTVVSNQPTFFRRCTSLMIASGLMLSTIVGIPAAHANPIFTVNTLADTIDLAPGNNICDSSPQVGEQCSLRAAIMEANALAGADTIAVPLGTYNLSLPGWYEDNSVSGDLDIKGNLTISGAGQANTIIDGMKLDRVIHVAQNSSVTMNGITIQGGFLPVEDGGTYSGAGIYNLGTVTLKQSKVQNNELSGHGGGIYSSGTLTVSHSSIVNNTANDNHQGGGIDSYGPLALNNALVGWNVGGEGSGVSANGPTRITNSTITANSREGLATDTSVQNQVTIIGSTISNNNGNGINFFGSTSTIANSTISGNGGVGIHLGQHTTALNQVTVAGNTGPGLYQSGPSTLSLRNSISAGNGTASGAGDCSGTLTSFGYNLIQNTASCTLTGDLTGNIIGQDPLLGPLQKNGGLTETRALLEGSPAIDTASPAPDSTCLATDQRGAARPQDGNSDGFVRCDIGAFEVSQRR